MKIKIKKHKLRKMDNLIKRMRMRWIFPHPPTRYSHSLSLHHSRASHFTHISFREQSNFIRIRQRVVENAQLQNKSVAYVNWMGEGKWRVRSPLRGGSIWNSRISVEVGYSQFIVWLLTQQCETDMLCVVREIEILSSINYHIWVFEEP